MGRKELEKKLTALGWRSLGQSSGKGHTAWYHPTLGRLPVPDKDIILDRLAAEILTLAKG